MEGNNRVRVVMLAGLFRIKGEIELVPGARVTDYMVESKPFIAVTNAEVWEMEGRRIMVVPFLNVSRDHVVIVAPDA